MCADQDQCFDQNYCDPDASAIWRIISCARFCDDGMTRIRSWPANSSVAEPMPIPRRQVIRLSLVVASCPDQTSAVASSGSKSSGT